MTLTINHNISSGSYMTFDHEIKLDMHLFLLLTQATVQLQHVDVEILVFLICSLPLRIIKIRKKKNNNFQSLPSLNLMIYSSSEYINY